MYVVYFAGVVVAEVPKSEVAQVTATFECFVDDHSRTIVLLR